MPWEKSFNLDDALARATKVFWAKGYEATSMADLVAGMGINKGSLYNAFGSKKELFTRALLQYDRDNRQAMLAQLEALDDPLVAVTRLFDVSISESIVDTEKKGCLLVNTALELPNHTDDVRGIIGTVFDDFEAFFKRLIKRGQKRGVISKDVKANDTAKSLFSLLIGIRVLARGDFDASGLRAIKRDALRLISGGS
jgi:TetR/AcrR family transcriptional repressor of nem operon